VKPWNGKKYILPYAGPSGIPGKFPLNQSWIAARDYPGAQETGFENGDSSNTETGTCTG
jgi:hypothetical protein